MIDLDPGDELELLRETARLFGADHLAPRMRDAEAKREVDGEVRGAYAEIGLAGLELPEEAGGAGLGALARVLVNEELAACDAGAALALDPVAPALYPLLEMGADASELLTEDRRTLLATDLDGAVRLGATVDAEISWVACERADLVVLLAGARAAVVRDGIELEPLRGAGLRAAGAARLRIAGASPIVQLEDAAGAARARARARLYYAALMLGSMRAACEFSAAYAQEREAFGRPIAHHQALAFLITDMQIALDSARLLVHEAAWRIDARLPAAAAAASAFAQCIEAARLVGPNGVQILGGHGFMADYPVEKHMRELRALGLVLGGFDAAIEESGRSLSAHSSPLSLHLGGAL
jgi:alkylation response protein AidB-like acyl-CoA dehydrogenase